MESTAPYVYSEGENVKFEGQPAVVVSASKVKRDMFGVESQSLEISRYNGMLHSLIGSRHSALAPIEQEG